MAPDPSPTAGSGLADPGGSRQKGSTETRAPPRQACTECRRRKIKCSGFGKNGCKTCRAAGMQCVFPESQKRGPHKGYFETISTRLSRIERMLQDAIDRQDQEKREGSSDDECNPSHSRANISDPHERKRRRPNKYRRHSHEQTLSPVAALLAPKSSTAPEIPFHSFRPRFSIASHPSPELSSPEESALGVLAQVAHEMEPTCGVDKQISTDPKILSEDLAASIVKIYFERVHPHFPIVNKNSFLSAFHRIPEGGVLSDHLAWAVFLAGSAFSNDHRLQEGPENRIQIEKYLKHACERSLEEGNCSDLSLTQALILGQLFPAKRERKFALLSWAINGRAVKLALKRRLNVNPQKLGYDSETCEARIATWWCVYLVDIWDSARRGRPPTIHESEYDVPLPSYSNPSNEEIFFVRLVLLTKILSSVLCFAYNSNQSASLAAPDLAAEEVVRSFRTKLAEWYRSPPSRLDPLLASYLHIAYLTVVILLHRPLLPTPLATAFQDPIVLLVTKCATEIVHVAQLNRVKDAGSVPWRLFVPAVGYLTAGMILVQNATWSTHITGANPLRLSAQREVLNLLAVFDEAGQTRQHITGMSTLLRDIIRTSGVDLNTLPDRVVPEIEGIPLPLPHEDPSFIIAQLRSIPMKSMSAPEKRPSTMLQSATLISLPAPRSHSMSDASSRKRKHDSTGQQSTSQKPGGQPLPPLAVLTGMDPRSPTTRSVHSMSTYSSHSSASHGRHGQIYSAPTTHTPSTAYHPSYGTGEMAIPGRVNRQWEELRPMSPLPPLYDRRYPDAQTTYPPSSTFPQPYYPDRREEYPPRPASPTHSYDQHITFPRPSFPSSDPAFARPPPTLDPRYRQPTPPLSAAPSNSPSWPPGYPYPTPQQRYESSSPRTVHGQNRWPEYYNYPSQRS